MEKMGKGETSLGDILDQGVSWAIAWLISAHGQDSLARDMARNWGLTIADLDHVDPKDRDVILESGILK